MWRCVTIRYKNRKLLSVDQSKNTGHLQSILPLFLLFLLTLLSHVSCTATLCGGTYSASQGIIQTPGFPKEFQTPIDCEWIIDASHVDHCVYAGVESYNTVISGNRNYKIIIYFTQMYLLHGLSFTEYYNYSNSKNVLGNNVVYKSGEERLKVDLLTTPYIQSCANYLVIRLHLDTVVTTHIRVLNNFLDVYGFNVTYEITTDDIREDRCKMSICGFTGYCYYNFKSFFCECLPGFKGRYCSEGPKSLCVKNGYPICQKNEICKLIGETAVKCEKPKQKKNAKKIVFRESTKSNSECHDCRISCPFNKSHKNICNCSHSLWKSHDPRDVRYSGNIILKNITTSNSNVTLMEDYLVEQITETLEICNASTNNLSINKLKYIDNDLIVYFHFLGFRDDKAELRNCFRKSLNESFRNFNFLEKKVTLNMEPTLFLKSLTINKKYTNGVLKPIHEGQEFILSCMAIGSPNMAFRWYKNNMFINITTPASSNKWIQLLRKDINNTNKWGAYWSLLVVSGARELDDGRFTCQVIDDGRQQCASQLVEVSVVPAVFIEPSSLTVKKGESFIMKCRVSSRSSTEDTCHFNWLENGITVLNNAESLYPKGSLLKISGINKTTTYSCTKTCIAENIIKEATITVFVYDSTKEILCKADSVTKNIVLWPDTAPGAVSVVGCPDDYTGFASRLCMLTKHTKSHVDNAPEKIIGKWDEPDFSGCLHDSLSYIKRNFERLNLGYENTTALRIMNKYKQYVNSMNGLILSSEGKRIFMLLDEVLIYIINSSNFRNIPEITKVILDITDVLLSNNNDNAIYTKNDIIYMQKVVKSVLFLVAKTIDTRQFNREKFNIEVSYTYNDESNEENSVEKLLCIYYFNLTAKVCQVLNKSDGKLEYRLISDIRSVFVLNGTINEENELTVFVNITDWSQLDQVNNNFHDEWQAQCVVSDWGFDWNEKVCTTAIDIHRHIAKCRCAKDGTFAVAYVRKTKIIYEAIGVNKVLIPLLYAISLFFSLVCLLVSLIQLRFSKNAVSFMQCHSSISKLILCIIFFIGTCSNLAEESYLNILSTILFCYLLALSSQLAILMITFSEVEDMLQKESAKIAVVEIFIVGSILVTIGNHIAHASIVVLPPFWWIKMADNLSFNVFILCLVVILLLFIILYWILWNFIKKEINLGCMFIYTKYNRVKKCSYVFCAFLTNVVFSIFYINYIENIALHYLLVLTFILIDVTTLFCNTDYHRFHIPQIVTKVRNKSKRNAGKSLKNIHIFNKK